MGCFECVRNCWSRIFTHNTRVCTEWGQKYPNDPMCVFFLSPLVVLLHLLPLKYPKKNSIIGCLLLDNSWFLFLMFVLLCTRSRSVWWTVALIGGRGQRSAGLFDCRHPEASGYGDHSSHHHLAENKLNIWRYGFIKTSHYILNQSSAYFIKVITDYY